MILHGPRPLLAVALVLVAALLHSGSALAQGDVPGYLVPVRANIWEAAPGALQFGMKLAQPPPASPAQSITYIWFVDADNNSRTGQQHGAVGSDYNVRVVVGGPNGGGCIDGIDGRKSSGGYPYMVDGDSIYLRIPLAQFGSPSRFNWSCTAFTDTAHGPSLGDDEPGHFVRPTAPPRDDQPVRVIIDPYLQLCDGVNSGVGDRTEAPTGGMMASSESSIRQKGAPAMRCSLSLFAQILQIVPRADFESLVRETGAERQAKGLTCWAQFVAMLFCQLGQARSLREISDGQMLHRVRQVLPPA